MALHREREFVGRHAGAVVGDRDEVAATLAHDHVDAPRAGVDGVLDEFLDRARRALDHLAGGDAVDERLRQDADGHDGARPLAPASVR